MRDERLFCAVCGKDGWRTETIKEMDEAEEERTKWVVKWEEEGMCLTRRLSPLSYLLVKTHILKPSTQQVSHLFSPVESLSSRYKRFPFASCRRLDVVALFLWKYPQGSTCLPPSFQHKNQHLSCLPPPLLLSLCWSSSSPHIHTNWMLFLVLRQKGMILCCWLTR